MEKFADGSSRDKLLNATGREKIKKKKNRVAAQNLGEATRARETRTERLLWRVEGQKSLSREYCGALARNVDDATGARFESGVSSNHSLIQKRKVE